MDFDHDSQHRDGQSSPLGIVFCLFLSAALWIIIIYVAFEYFS